MSSHSATRRRCSHRINGLHWLVAAAAWLAVVPLRAGEAVLALKPGQVAALGLKTQTVAAADAAAASTRRYPAAVTIPTTQQWVLAAPLPALVESVRVSTGDTVRAGQVVAVLRSAQAQELQHDLHVTSTQAALAGSALARDEQLFLEGLISQARLESTRAQAGLAVEQRDERQSALTQAGGSAQAAGGRLTLVAPRAGVVLERPVVVGQRVDTAAPLIRIAQLAPLWVEMQVPASEAAALRPGNVVRLAGHATVGRVVAIGSTVDPASQSVMVRAEVRPPLDGLRAGQVVEAEVERGADGLLQLPSAAVLKGAEQAIVFVETGAGQYRAAVVREVSSSGNVTTVSGLPAGSKVVVQGTAALKAMLAPQRP
jgi:RND family efflux transporter MFP subunit